MPRFVDDLGVGVLDLQRQGNALGATEVGAFQRHSHIALDLAFTVFGGDRLWIEVDIDITIFSTLR